MMMTMPAPAAAATTKYDDTRSNMTADVKNKASPKDAVQDLEKGLERLGQVAPAPAAPTLSELKAATPASAPPAEAAAAQNADLLSRIMAAQERAKQPAAPAPAVAPAAAPDLLDIFDAPAESESAHAPPFDVLLLPTQTPAPLPSAFDTTTLPPPAAEEQQNNHKQHPSVSWDPNVTVVDAAPPDASAPVFVDLLDSEQQQEDQKMPPPSYVTPVAPPSSTSSSGMDQEAIDAILGIEGLSDEEKAALIAEQEKIMASIEQQKQQNSPALAGGAVARADAFEQRSHAAAVQAIGNTSTKPAPRTVDLGDGNELALHGQKKTFEAIKDGTAVLVQCLSCENWMQVTGKATMMFCPVCQTVSPVASADDKAAASQMASDMELAEQLQKEEYKKAEKRQAAQRAKKKAEEQAQQQQDGSWMEWLGFGAPAPASPAGTPPSFAQKPVERGEIGVSLPPGASRNNAALAMAPAYTGREDDSGTPAVAFSSSRDESVDSDVGPAGGRARVAQQQPLFNCVADSISSAATQMYNTLSQDEQGNVHGVNTKGLLAVSQTGWESNNNAEGAGYQIMNRS